MASAPTKQPLVRRLAGAVLRHANRPRGSLRAYRRVVNDVVREAEERDSPF